MSFRDPLPSSYHCSGTHKTHRVVSGTQPSAAQGPAGPVVFSQDACLQLLKDNRTCGVLSGPTAR